MGEELKKPKTEKEIRFLEAVKEVIKLNGFKNEKEFLMKIKLKPSLLSKIKSGDRAVHAEEISILEKTYGVNQKYIYFNEGPIFLDVLKKNTEKEENLNTDSTQNDISKFNKILEKLIDSHERDKERLDRDKQTLENAIEKLQKDKEHLYENEQYLKGLIEFFKKQIEGK